MDSIKLLARDIIKDLRENELSNYADSLQKSIDKLDSSESAIEGLSEIEGACHVKAYGDLYLETFSGWEWPNKVSKLGNMCRKKKEALQIS